MTFNIRKFYIGSKEEPTGLEVLELMKRFLDDEIPDEDLEEIGMIYKGQWMIRLREDEREIFIGETPPDDIIIPPSTKELKPRPINPKTHFTFSEIKRIGEKYGGKGKIMSRVWPPSDSMYSSKEREKWKKFNEEIEVEVDIGKFSNEETRKITVEKYHQSLKKMGSISHDIIYNFDFGTLRCGIIMPIDRDLIDTDLLTPIIRARKYTESFEGVLKDLNVIEK
ncbi:MAG: hypothetical protein J7L45_03460 [Candidatus Aenigmarchaeota archaeon]|nr:hypothetical protein [Candidatus Aenigmarchaeota archaeon]